MKRDLLWIVSEVILLLYALLRILVGEGTNEDYFTVIFMAILVVWFIFRHMKRY